MSVIFGAGWECGHKDAGGVGAIMPLGGGSCAVGASYARTGVYGMQITGTDPDGYKYTMDFMPTGETELWFGFAYKPASLAYGSGYSECARFAIILDNGQTVELRYQGDHMLDLYVGGSKVANGSVAILNAWNFFEIHLLVNASGEVDVKINGTLDIEYSGSTVPSGAASISSFRFQAHRTTQNPIYYFDDFSVDDAAWTDDIQWVKAAPTADTAQDDFTPSSGSDNYAMVDEVPPSDVDYNESIVNAESDLMDIADFDGTDKTIKCVVVWARAVKTPASSQQMKVLAKSGTTTDAGSAEALTASYDFKAHVMALNPDDLAAWEDADVDALQIGYESVI